MARVYRGSNHLCRSARQNWWSGMLLSALCMGYAYWLWTGPLYYQWYDVWPILIFGILAHCLFGRAAKYSAGLQGERRSLKYAKKLPDSYYVFTNVIFGHAGRRTEIDIVVVGATGVFVLEVKNHCGRIKGDANKEEWHQYLGRRGQYTRPLYNPLRQANRQAYKLAEALRSKAIGVWVESAVVFANKAANVEVKHQNRPILTSPKQICRFILDNHYAQPLERSTVEKIAEAIYILQKKAG